MFVYGMRLRPYGMGCQPKGVCWVCDCEDVYRPSGEYWSIICYLHPLTEEECRAYDLDYLGREEDINVQ